MIWKIKRFHISNAGTESILHSIHNLTKNIYATDNNSNDNNNYYNNNNNSNNNNINNNDNTNKKVINIRRKCLSMETLSDKSATIICKNIGKIVQVKKKLSPQAKQYHNTQWDTALQLPPTIADFKT